MNFFHGYVDCTVVLTRDLFFHVYTFHDAQAHSKLITNVQDSKETSDITKEFEYHMPLGTFIMANVISVSQVKDKLEIT